MPSVAKVSSVLNKCTPQNGHDGLKLVGMVDKNGHGRKIFCVYPHCPPGSSVHYYAVNVNHHEMKGGRCDRAALSECDYFFNSDNLIYVCVIIKSYSSSMSFYFWVSLYFTSIRLLLRLHVPLLCIKSY